MKPASMEQDVSVIYLGIAFAVHVCYDGIRLRRKPTVIKVYLSV